MKCFDCLSELVCKYNNGASDYYKGDCPHFQPKNMFWLKPHCERCGTDLNVQITEYRCVNNKFTRAAIAFDPPTCPKCDGTIDSLQIDYVNRKCVVKIV